MPMCGSIFFDISLPNPSTWFYFSGLLAVALFFKFSRLLSIRNLDVVTLYLPTPGFLLLAESPNEARWAYLWLFVASGYFFLRCLIDLTLVRRPGLSPNLTVGGLIWLMGALFVSLLAVAARHPGQTPAEPDKTQGPIEDIRRKEMPRLLKPAVPNPDDPQVQTWVERGLTLFCHLLIVIGMVLIGWRHYENVQAGAAAGAFYLLLPYTFLLVPGTSTGLGRWDHAWPMALMVWAVFAYRRPAVAGALLGTAVGTVLFPILVFPIWLSFYRGRGAGRFSLSFFASAGVCLLAISGWFWLSSDMPESLRAWRLSTWLPWWEPPVDVRGLWPAWGIHWAYRIPVFIAYIAFLAPTMFWPSPKNLAHVLALSAAALIGVQFWFADQGGVYVLWYLPFLLLLVFRPNLSACQPPPGNGRRSRLGLYLRRLFARPFRSATTAPVP